ncbi:hypothetical protein ACFY09_37280, partial [Streptomyces sp. NPDC001389]
MRRTLFSLLLQERRPLGWEAFCVHFAAAAAELARETGNRRLAAVTVGRTTFDRWSSGTWYGRPRGEAAQILEHMFGHTVDVLFSPAGGAEDLARPIIEAAERIGSRWSTSRLFLPADASAGTWELTGRQSLDGTAAAVHFLSVTRRGEDAGPQDMDEDGRHELERFLRPARRGFLVGVEEQDNDLQLYVRDAGPARRTAGARMSIPSAYLLDDLTYGILWSLTQLDDGLLAVDQALDAEQRLLSTYLDLPRSAPRPCFRSGFRSTPRAVMITVWGVGIFLMSSGR